MTLPSSGSTIRRGRHRKLLPRIDDLDERAVGAGGRQPGEHVPDLRHRRPEIRQHHDFGERRRHEGRRQARARRLVMQHRLRHLVDHVAARGRVHQAGNADAFAACDQKLSQRKGHDQSALQLGVARLFGGKGHRQRAVGPKPYGVRGLPFLLTDIEMIVARASPPIDPATARRTRSGGTARNSPARRAVRADRG